MAIADSLPKLARFGAARAAYEGKELGEVGNKEKS